GGGGGVAGGGGGGWGGGGGGGRDGRLAARRGVGRRGRAAVRRLGRLDEERRDVLLPEEGGHPRQQHARVGEQRERPAQVAEPPQRGAPDVAPLRAQRLDAVVHVLQELAGREVLGRDGEQGRPPRLGGPDRGARDRARAGLARAERDEQPFARLGEQEAQREPVRRRHAARHADQPAHRAGRDREVGEPERDAARRT